MLVLKKCDRKKNVEEVVVVLDRCRKGMHSPKMMHFISEIDIDKLPSKIIQPLKQRFGVEFKKYEKTNRNNLKKRKQPRLEVIYSIEAKMLYGKIYNHIHFMFIIDFGNHLFGYKEITTIINNTLNSLPFIVPLEKESDFKYKGFYGTNKDGFLRYRDRRSTITSGTDFSELRGHDLKTEFEDAIIRASYLCKSEQKELLPSTIKKNSFNHTRCKKIKESSHSLAA